MMRDSPPELARAFAGPYSSRSRTLAPDLRRQYAVHAPKTPAPTTATSYVFAAFPMLFTCPPIRSAGDVLHLAASAPAEPMALRNWRREDFIRTRALSQKPSSIRRLTLSRDRAGTLCESRRLSTYFARISVSRFTASPGTIALTLVC